MIEYNSNHDRVFMAIDPGYDRIGWAIGMKVSGQLKINQSGLIQTDKKKHIFERYQYLLSNLESVLKQYKPHELAIESLFFSKNTSTAIRVSEARGVIIGCCLQHSMTVFEYNPTQIKLTVAGNGSADKTTIAKMLSLQTSITVHDKLDDELDALALLLTHSVLHKWSLKEK